MLDLRWLLRTCAPKLLLHSSQAMELCSRVMTTKKREKHKELYAPARPNCC